MKKSNKKLLLRLAGMVLALAMVVTLLPGVAFAASDSSTSEGIMPTAAEDTGDENLVLKKSAKLEDDGTYTINLEAYAKGEVTTTVVKQVVPTDVILILDQSGSMNTTITGIPSDTYSAANPTNLEVVNGYYYYKVEENYYRVTATKEIISKTTAWVGDDGQQYDEVSDSWTASNGKVYNTARPFATTTLKTYTRHTTTDGIVIKRNYPHFINDRDSTDDVGGLLIMNMSSLREEFINKKQTGGAVATIHNDGIPEDVTGWTAQDPYYVAAVYVPVTQQEVNTCCYVYTYVDDSGNTVTIGRSEELIESELDNAACAINPLYTRDTKDGTRLEALQYAANKFIDSIRQNALANNVDHRVAVIGFASSGENYNSAAYENTELFVGATQYPYNGTGDNAPSSHYTEALQSAGTDAGYENLQSSIDSLAMYGGTYPQYGFEMANGVFAKNSAAYTKADGTEGTRSRVIIFMTDGEPGSGGSVDATEANATIDNAAISKNTYSAKVYSVAVQNSVGTDQANFLNSVSTDGTHTEATSAEELEDFFTTVSSEITESTTTVNLTKDAYLVDTLSEYFVVPKGFTVSDNVTVKTAQHVGDEAFLNATDSSYAATLVTADDGTVTGISVTGFDYVANQVTTSISDGGSTVASGSKLVVEIKGLLAKDSAAVGTYINTNSANSGIWDKDEDGNYGQVKAFNQPVTKLTKQVFVIDYAKETELKAFDTSAAKVDSGEDSLFSKVSESDTSLAGEFGTAAVSGGKLTYTPQTMNWSGYDTFYALGKDNGNGDQMTKNLWSKISVLPANNVYYEDDFITNTKEGIVGIEYGGGWETVTPENGGNSNSTVSNDGNNSTHGWEASYADDTGYSDGSAHKAIASADNVATATFSFTGTGVDVYSRTDMTTGTILAILSAQTEKGEAFIQALNIDNKAASANGAYYQIPTLSFCELEYGTYKVTLYVTTAAASEARYTYYLDGIRVYNPLSYTQEGADDVISDAYGDEVGAIFSEIRNLLLAADSLGNEDDTGFVFIDQIEDETGVSTSEIGTYESYGPENEVYLAKDQAIAFRVDPTAAKKFCVGLKAPNGATTVKVTQDVDAAEIQIAGASDMYYKVTPSEDGTILIKNTGDNLLAVTKLKTSGFLIEPEEDPEGEVFSTRSMLLSFSADEMITYANSFDELPVVEYNAEPEVPVEPEQPVDPEQPGDVEIENPEPEVPERPQSPLRSLLEKIFRGIRDWFKP